MALKQNEANTPPKLSAAERVKKAFKCAVELETIKGMKIALHGREKTGKSRFTGTAPLPLYIIDTEGSWHLTKEDFTLDRQKQMFVSEVLFDASKKDNKVDVISAMDAMFEAIDAITDLIKETPSEKSGTIIIDSITDLWDWLAIWKDTAVFNTPGGGTRLEWGHANKRYAEFILMLLHSQWHVILTGKSDPMVSDKGADIAGMDKAKWQKKTGYYVDIIAEMKKDVVTGKRSLTLKGDRLGDIREVINDPTWDIVMNTLTKRTRVKFG